MKKFLIFLLIMITAMSTNVSANNPVIKTDDKGNRVYSGDPAAIVVGDTVYLFAGHDTSGNDRYYMPEWLCYSSKDLIDWKYEGVPMKASDFSWGSGADAWAGEVEYYNGKYYFFMCKNATGISVGVSDNITGPYTDHLNGERLVYPWWTRCSISWDDIDPTVWIENDEHGVEHRYIMWGNTNLYIAELNEEMNSLVDLSGDGVVDGGDITHLYIQEMPEGVTFTEAPWIYKRGDIYYLFFANNWHEELSYATSKNVAGPYTYGGKIMEAGASSNTNHPSVIDFKGKTYIFYHTGAMENGSGYRRCVCIDELRFNEDGSIDLFEESSIGIDGEKVYIQPVNDSEKLVFHEHFDNTTEPTAYPGGSVVLCDNMPLHESDAWWEIVPGRAGDEYVSIQSVNKMGYFITNFRSHIKLIHDNDATAETALSMSFIERDGLSGDGVSYESASEEGMYLTVKGDMLYLTNGEDKEASTFIVNPIENYNTMQSFAGENGIHIEGVYKGNGKHEILYIKNDDETICDFKVLKVEKGENFSYTFLPEKNGEYTVVFGKFSAKINFEGAR